MVYTINSLTYAQSAILTTLWVRNVENEHAAHEHHIREENGGELPPTPEYDYLNRRVRPFPWGMNSLFFNPHVRITAFFSILYLISLMVSLHR